MELIYKKNAFGLNIIVNYVIIFLLFFVTIRIYGYSYTTLSITTFFMFIVSYLYRATILNIKNILSWTIKSVDVDKVIVIGNGTLEKSSQIDSIEFVENSTKVLAKNIDTFFFPILKPKDNIMENGLNLDSYKLKNLEVYCNPSNKEECYFHVDIFYYMKLFKKIYIGMLIVLFVPFINIVFKLFFYN